MRGSLLFTMHGILCIMSLWWRSAKRSKRVFAVSWWQLHVLKAVIYALPLKRKRHAGIFWSDSGAVCETHREFSIQHERDKAALAQPFFTSCVNAWIESGRRRSQKWIQHVSLNKLKNSECASDDIADGDDWSTRQKCMSADGAAGEKDPHAHGYLFLLCMDCRRVGDFVSIFFPRRRARVCARANTMRIRKSKEPHLFSISNAHRIPTAQYLCANLIHRNKLCIFSRCPVEKLFQSRIVPPSVYIVHICSLHTLAL